MSFSCAVAPAPGTPFENSHTARLNPATEKIISVEVNNHRVIRRRFNCFCVGIVVGLDLAFLFNLNLILGCSFRVDAKIQSLITERGFIDGLYGCWRYSETRLGGLQFLPLSANNPFA
jgi:hypothetical protein